MTVLDIHQFNYFGVILCYWVHRYPEMFIIKTFDSGSNAGKGNSKALRIPRVVKFPMAVNSRTAKIIKAYLNGKNAAHPCCDFMSSI